MQAGPRPDPRPALRARSAMPAARPASVCSRIARKSRCPAAKPGLHDEIESDLIKRLAAGAVVEPAQRNGRLIILAPERGIEEPLVDRGREAAALGPGGHGARLLDVDQRGVAQDRRALGRGRDDVDVLQDQAQVLRAGEGQEPERPKIGLAEMAKPDEPQPRGQEREHGLGDGGAKPVTRGRRMPRATDPLRADLRRQHRRHKERLH